MLLNKKNLHAQHNIRLKSTGNMNDCRNKDKQFINKIILIAKGNQNLQKDIITLLSGGPPSEQSDASCNQTQSYTVQQDFH